QAVHAKSNASVFRNRAARTIQTLPHHFTFKATPTPLRGQEVYLDPQGRIQGKVKVLDEQGRPTSGAGFRVLLLKDGQPHQETLTRPDGSFVFTAKEPGHYTFAGDFSKALNDGSSRGKTQVRQVGFPNSKTLLAQAPNADPLTPPADPPTEPNAIPGLDDLAPVPVPNGTGNASLEGGEDLPPELQKELLDNPIGTPANRNAAVFLDGDGKFRFLRPRSVHHASNDEVFLAEDNTFRGILTTLEDDMIRRPMAHANVYLARQGKIHARTITASNGAFILKNLKPGAYTLAAEYGFVQYRRRNGASTETKTVNPAAMILGSRGSAEEDGNGNGEEFIVFDDGQPNESGNGLLAQNGNNSSLGLDEDGNIDPSQTAWERERAGLPWTQYPGQVAMQRLAVRPFEEADMGPVAELRRPGGARIVRVNFLQAAATMPVLHLSAVPVSLDFMPSESAESGGGGAAASTSSSPGGGGGGGGGIAGGFPAGFFGPGGGGGTTPVTASPAS
ncbi:MAG: carboxypeptidase-like regulatory domain-containing protein, partial [Planctomycetales bacterium]